MRFILTQKDRWQQKVTPPLFELFPLSATTEALDLKHVQVTITGRLKINPY